MKTLAERAVLTVSLILFFIAGYFGIGLSRTPDQARELKIFLDDKIPFVVHSVWIYLLIFPSALIPLFVVRCQRLFRRTAIAYVAAISFSLICFAVFPVTSSRVRVDQAALNLTRASDWAVATLYSIDPPYNLFPSLHLSIAVLAAFAAWKASRLYGAAAFITLIFIGGSVCTVKQHVVLDALAGVGLGAFVGGLVLGPYRPDAGVEQAYSWRGPLLYVAFLMLVYAGFYLIYRTAA